MPWWAKWVTVDIRVVSCPPPSDDVVTKVEAYFPKSFPLAHNCPVESQNAFTDINNDGGSFYTITGAYLPLSRHRTIPGWDTEHPPIVFGEIFEGQKGIIRLLRCMHQLQNVLRKGLRDSDEQVSSILWLPVMPKEWRTEVCLPSLLQFLYRLSRPQPLETTVSIQGCAAVRKIVRTLSDMMIQRVDDDGDFGRSDSRHCSVDLSGRCFWSSWGNRRWRRLGFCSFRVGLIRVCEVVFLFLIWEAHRDVFAVISLTYRSWLAADLAADVRPDNIDWCGFSWDEMNNPSLLWMRLFQHNRIIYQISPWSVPTDPDYLKLRLGKESVVFGFRKKQLNKVRLSPK